MFVINSLFVIIIRKCKMFKHALSKLMNLVILTTFANIALLVALMLLIFARHKNRQHKINSTPSVEALRHP